MNLFAVSFFGHRQVDDPFLIERQLESIIRELLGRALFTRKMTRHFSVGLILRKSLMFWNTLQANLMIPKSSKWLKVQNL